MQLQQVKKIAVIGAGTMGAGIAQACAAAGFQVAMRDIDQRFVDGGFRRIRSEEHTSELQSHHDLVCRLLLEKKKKKSYKHRNSKTIVIASRTLTSCSLCT